MPPPLAKQKSDLDVHKVGGWRSEVNQSPSDFRGLVDAAQRPVLMSPNNGGGAPMSSSPSVDPSNILLSQDAAIGETLNFSTTGSPARGGTADHNIHSNAGRLSSSSGLITPQPRIGTAQSSATPPPMAQSANSIMSLVRDASRQGGSSRGSRRPPGDHSDISGSDSDSSTGSIVAEKQPPAAPTVAAAPLAVVVEATVEPRPQLQEHGLYTFQKRSLRHSRQNWKSAASMNNAQCLPQPDVSVLHALARLQGRHHLTPMKAVAASVKPPQQATQPTATTAPAVPTKNPTPTQGSGVAQNATTPPPAQPSSLPAPATPQPAPRTPSVLFSRTTSPTVAATSIIPSHAHPSDMMSNRPPSQLALSELILSPPGTASRMLSRNLLGLTINSRDGGGLDSTMNTRGTSTPDWRLSAAVDGGNRINASGSGGLGLASFQASASIIGSLRPNSVMSKLAPIVSTSMGAHPQVSGSDIGGGGAYSGTGLPPRGRGGKQLATKSSVGVGAQSLHKGEGNSSASVVHGVVVSPRSDSGFVGDPVEAGIGGGGGDGAAMFVTPNNNNNNAHSNKQHHQPPMPQVLTVVTPISQTLTASGKQMHVDQNAWGSTTSHTGTTTSSLKDPHETPNRLKTFGLHQKPPFYNALTSSQHAVGPTAARGEMLDFSSYESLLGPQWPQQSTFELQRLQQHLPQNEAGDGGVTSLSGSSMPSPMGQLVAVVNRQRRQQQPLEVVSSSPRRMSPARSQSPVTVQNQSQPQKQSRTTTTRRLRNEDPLQCIQRVCAWGYDLRSLFLVQLARDGYSLPRFVASLLPHRDDSGSGGEQRTHSTTLEAWVQWLEWGGSKPSDIPAAVEECLAQQKANAESMQGNANSSKQHSRPPPRARIAGSKEKQISELQSVVIAASEYVASTLFKGTHNSAHVAPRDQLPPPAPAQSDTSTLDRADVRKLLAEQGLQVRDVCHMFRHVLLTGMTLDAAQQLVKGWLMDPRTHSAKVDKCMRDLVNTADQLRDVFMESLHWNRQEREEHAYFVSVLDKAYHNEESNTPPAPAPPRGSWSESHRTQLAQERNLLLHLMEQLTESVMHFRRLAAHNESTEEPPETVESFCAIHYLSLSDICAWLARAPVFDRSILSQVWSFVIDQEARRVQRREPLHLLPTLHALLEWDEGTSGVTPGERSDEIYMLADRVQRITVSIGTSSKTAKNGNKGKRTSTTNADAIVARDSHQQRTGGAKRVPQDKFVLETIIGQLRLHDEEDRHNAALHGDPPTMLNATSKGWRSLAKNVAVHRELLFRQEAELLKHVVKRRAEVRHKSAMERLQITWRQQSEPTDRAAASNSPHTISSEAPSSSQAVAVVQDSSTESHRIEYRPKCQETLESFLSIQSLATERLPVGLIEELQRTFKQRD